MVSDDRILAELERRISFQIEEHRHLETLASHIFRIWLMILGGVLTVSIAVASGRVSPADVDTADTNSQPEELAELTSIINQDLASLILLSMLFLSFCFIVYSMYAIFIRAPFSALDVLRYPNLEPNPQIRSSNLNRQTSTLIHEYEAVALRNASQLEETRNSWMSCRRALERGIMSIFVSGVSLFTIFITFHKYITVAAYALVIYAAAKLLSKSTYSPSKYVFLDRYVASAHMAMFTISTISLYLMSEDIYTNVAIFLPAIPIFGLMPFLEHYTMEDLQKLSIRTIGIFFISFSFLFTMIFSSPPDTSTYADIMLVTFLCGVISSFYLSLFLVIIYTTLRIYDTLYELFYTRLADFLSEVNQ
jgi:hypothetical protein